MKKLLIATAIIIGIGVVAGLDRPEDHHLPELTRTEQRDYLDAYTTVDEYRAVSLNALRGRKCSQR